MSEPLRLLLVEDNPDDAALLVHAVGRIGRPIEWDRVETSDAMRAALAGRDWDAVIADWSLPTFSALAALKLVQEHRLDVPFIIVSGTIGEEAATDAMRAGAHDYILKDKVGRLVPALERELRECRDRAERREADAARLRAEQALRQSEEQLRHAQKMEAVGRLAGGVAHDFNNVLSVILSYGEIIASELPEGDPLRDDVEEIRKAAARAAGLTRQLLLFSRQQVLEPRVLDLGDVLAGMDKMIRRLLGEDVELSMPPRSTLGHVRADPSNIEQVILNLIVNARDAMPSGGKVTIETADVQLDGDYVAKHVAAKAGPHVMLAVTDTGSGMDRATQSRIFEPFFTTKGHGKGTGLGLSTVFGIVQQSGGSIWVYSEVGIGTTFKVYLPRVDAAVDVARILPAPKTLDGTETILVCEDEEQVRAIVLSVLRRHGYELLSAKLPSEAIQLFDEHRTKVDLLLTDVVMPQMSGPELSRRLSSIRPDLKLLCMSGYTDDSIVRHGVLEKGVAFLQKPFTPMSLARKVREVLDAPPPTPKVAPPT